MHIKNQTNKIRLGVRFWKIAKINVKIFMKLESWTRDDDEKDDVVKHDIP